MLREDRTEDMHHKGEINEQRRQKRKQFLGDNILSVLLLYSIERVTSKSEHKRARGMVDEKKRTVQPRLG
jgi:hypothetical protein